MKCPRCRMPIKIGDRICGVCGASLAQESALPAQEPAAPHVAMGQLQRGSSPFEVSCSAPELLRLGSVSTFFFHFSTVRDDLVRATFILRNEEGAVSEASVAAPCGECKMVITPQRPGDVWLDLELALQYRGASEPEMWKSDFHAQVEDKKTLPGSFVYAPHLVNSGVMRSEDGGIAAAPALSALTAPEDAGRYRCDRNDRKSLAFSLSKSPERIALVSGESESLLTVREQAVFGRGEGNVPCDCRLAVRGEDGFLDNDLTMRISNVHFRLERRNGAIWAFDGLAGRPSTNGTQVDGLTLTDEGLCLRPGRHLLSVMKNRIGDVLMDFVIDVCNSKYSGGAVSASVAKKDCDRPAVLMVPPDGEAAFCGGVSIAHDGARFLARCEDSLQHPLAIGGSVEAEGEVWHVEPPWRAGACYGR